MSTNTRGVVLISVMMIMLILSAIGVSLSQNYFLALKREGYVNFENNAFQYIRAIEVLSEEEMKKIAEHYNKLPLLEKLNGVSELLLKFIITTQSLYI